jgi:Nif-specific regulatory protein
MQSPRVVLTTLLELTNQAARGLTVDELLQRVTDVAIRLVPAEHVSVRLMQRAGGALVCRARAGVGTEAPPMHLRTGEGILGWVVERGRGAHVRDTREDDRFKDVADQGFTVRSVLAVPLKVSGEVLGVLAMSASVPHAFSADDEVLAQLLGNWTLPFIELFRLRRSQSSGAG